MADVKLGGMTIKTMTGGYEEKRLSALLWGDAGSGKSVYASTAPGTKLWLLFDPDGTMSLSGRDDVQVLDFASESDSIVDKFISPAFYNELGNYLNNNPQIETVVFDSITTFGAKALSHGVALLANDAVARRAKFVPTITTPGQDGYGKRHNYTKYMMSNLLALTGKLKRHMIFIGHNGGETKDEKGNTIEELLNAGAKLVSEGPNLLSEVWYLRKVRVAGQAAKRYVYVDPQIITGTAMTRPMKTRIFNTNNVPNPRFLITYDQTTGEGGPTIANLWKQLCEKKSKLSLPTT